MKAQELRIGNFVNNKRIPAIRDYAVKQIHYDHLVPHEYLINGYDIEEYEPIPLTEEWLEKFGCIMRTKKNFWNKELDFSVDVESTFVKDELLYYYLVCNQQRRKSIQYVHQLQNLYFALTGEELEIK